MKGISRWGRFGVSGPPCPDMTRMVAFEIVRGGGNVLAIAEFVQFVVI